METWSEPDSVDEEVSVGAEPENVPILDGDERDSSASVIGEWSRVKMTTWGGGAGSGYYSESESEIEVEPDIEVGRNDGETDDYDGSGYAADTEGPPPVFPSSTTFKQ
jgi:hypothetical protein